MVFNCKPIFNSDKNNNPDEEANEMVSFSLVVHACSYLNAVELFVKGIKGVERVKCDGISTLEVMGKVKPVKIQEMVKHKTKTVVELILPLTGMKGVRDDNKGTKAKFMRRVIPIPGNDVANEKIEESTINLKIKLNCNSCNKNLQKILKTKGLEILKIQEEKDLVTLRGTVNMTELRSCIKDKLKKDIEVENVGKVMAPTKKDNAVVSKDRVACAVHKKREGKSGGNWREEGGSMVKSTVVLKIKLDCDGCIKRIRKAIQNCRGVETVSINAFEGLVTVEGTMDVQALTSYLKRMIKGNVEVVPVYKNERKAKRDAWRSTNSGQH